MAVLLTVRGIGKHFASRTLFSGVSLSVDERECLALIGPNGAGKSTLLKILAGTERADGGEVSPRRGLSVAYVAQSDVFGEGATALSAVVGALEAAAKAGGVPHLHDHHEIELAAEMTLDRVGLGEVMSALCASLSGGQRKRLSIARAMAQEPDLLLLDEPTNHLDVEGIEWLEGVLRSGGFASVVVTHDRAFLERRATRIVELSSAYPDGTFSVRGGYEEFLRRKGEFLEAQAKQVQTLSAQVKEDLRWLSRGAKARRTKSKSRIDQSMQRMDELADLKARNAPARAAQIDFTATDRQTKKLLAARGLSKAYGDRALFANLDVLLTPGTKLGLIGANGSGKSTLLRILTGETESDPPTPAMLREEEEMRELLPRGAPPLGTVQRAENLRTVLFSQHRTELDPDSSLERAMAPLDRVDYRGRSLHIATWAQMFLFSKEQLRTPVRLLSGGEQARVQIARLMLEPADVLILDEPTNDLDLASLEVLEESLEEFPGAVVLVTHDRAMLDRLATKVLALDGKGGARYYADYAQWERLSKAPAPKPAPDRAASAPSEPAPTAGARKKKLSFTEQHELAQMEGAIGEAESALATIHEEMARPEVMADHRKMAETGARMAAAQTRLDALYARWAELEAKSEGAAPKGV